MSVPQQEHQAFLPRQPQSMGGSSNDPPLTRWQRLKSAAHSPQTRSKTRTFLGITVTLCIFFAIFGRGPFRGSGGYQHHRTTTFIDKGPVQPDMGGEHDLEWAPSSQCRNTPHKFYKVLSDLTFDSGYKLSIEQRPEREVHRRGRTPHVSGQLLIRPSREQSEKGSIGIEIISNDERLTADTSIDIADGGKQIVKIITPRVLDWWDYNDQGPCVQMRITVYVPYNGYIDSLGLDVVHLDVELAEGLDMGTLDGLIINTAVGNVYAPITETIEDDVAPYSLQSRRIVIQTVSGDVKGWFPLYDLLKVESASGNIYLEVALKSTEKESAKQAKLLVHSISGTVNIKEPLASAVDSRKPDRELPARDYIVKVETASGDVQADVAMTSRADFQSVSGDLTLNLLPVLLKGSKRTDLRTDTKSGTTTITVLEPLEIDIGAGRTSLLMGTEVRDAAEGPALSNLQTSHQSISGDIRLVYPDSWTGKFKAGTISGDMSVKGKDVKITRSSRGIIKTVEGEKGQGNSFADLGSISGDLQLRVGKQ